MFETLSRKFGKIIHYIRGYGKLSAENVKEAARQIKLALLEADVHYTVVKQFVDSIVEKSLHQEVLSSMTPSQAFMEIVYNEIVSLLGTEVSVPDLKPGRTNRIFLFGSNGSGKTTTAVKLACYYRKFRPLIIAGDLTRPAAIDQLITLSKAADIDLYFDRKEKGLIPLIKRAEEFLADHDLVIYDTAGRFDTDAVLMTELKQALDIVKPDFRMLVVDTGEGQKGVDMVKNLHTQAGIDHVILSKMDSDAKGGLALSLRILTGIPIAFTGTGEKHADLELFSAEQSAKRIMNIFAPDLDLVEKVRTQIADAELEEVGAKDFNFNHFLKSLNMLFRGGLLGTLMKNIPGLPETASVDTQELTGFSAMVQSMSRWERIHPDLIDHKRRLRIAKGSGRQVQDVNILMKRFQAMKTMMKKFSGRKDVAMKDMLAQLRRR
jgi:signal recognition particle subunit SRP54